MTAKNPLRKRGYKVMELIYGNYSDKKRDELYQEIVMQLGRKEASMSRDHVEKPFLSGLHYAHVVCGSVTLILNGSI